MSWLVVGAFVVGGGIKAFGIGSENKKKSEARRKAEELKEQQLLIAGEDRDLALESGQQTSTLGQLDIGLQATAATKDIFSKASEQTSKTGMATQGTVQNIQTSAVGGITAKAGLDVKKLVDTRALAAEKTELDYEKTEMNIEEEYQDMLSANQSVTGWDAVGQVIGAGIGGASTGMSLGSAFTPTDVA